MAVARSPNYPQIDLLTALGLIRKAYQAEGRNKMSRSVLASHFGYNSLNGRALAKIGAVRAYGLIEGREDDLKISQDAIHCLEAPEGSPERAAALARCAIKPSVFKEIFQEYPTLPSEQNLRFHLIKKTYTPEAAGKATQNYLATMRFVEGPGGLDAEGAVSSDTSFSDMNEGAQFVEPGEDRRPGPKDGQPAGTRKAVFTLLEGDVTLTFPANLSADGYQELGDYLTIFLKRAQR